MHVVVVAGVKGGALCHPADVRESHVGDRDAKDEEREEQGRVEKVRLAAHSLCPTADLHRRRRHEQAEEKRAGIAHEHSGRIEVVRQESEADTARDHGYEWSEVARLERTQLDEP